MRRPASIFNLFFERSPGSLKGRQAYTLVEIMISMSIFMFVIGGVLAAHLIGMQLYNLGKAKMGASDEARNSVSLLFDEIRSAKSIDVGSGGSNYFTECADGTLQQGSAIQIYPTTNTSNFIRYYWKSDDTLNRWANSDAAPVVIVNSVSNNMLFTSEDHLGNVLTNNQNNRVIGLTLQIYQLQYPQITISTGGLFDYYRIRTKATRRTLE